MPDARSGGLDLMVVRLSLRVAQRFAFSSLDLWMIPVVISFGAWVANRLRVGIATAPREKS